MKRSEYRIALELGGSYGACRLDMKRSDTYRRIHIEFTDGGKPYPVSDDCCAVFLGRHKTGGLIYNACTVRNGAVEYDITPQTTAAPGILYCEVRLYDRQVTLEPDENGQLYLPVEDMHLITSGTFLIHIHDTVYRETELVNTQNEVSALDALVTEALAAIGDAKAVREAKELGELDGISVTHSWIGTKLLLTSASGNTATDLVGPAGPQGPKGDKGDKGEKGDPGCAVDDRTVGQSPWSSDRILKNLCPEFFCSGHILHCHPVAGDALGVEAECSGGTLTVTGCGKNLFDIKTYDLETEGYIFASNGTTSNSSTYRRTDYIPVLHLQGQVINLNCAPVSSMFPGMAFYDADKVYISGGKGNAITVPENAWYMRFSVPVDFIYEVQLEMGTEATYFEPYQSQTWEIDTDEKGSSFTLRPEAGMCNFFAWQDGQSVQLYGWGRSDPLPLLEKLAREVGYV